MRSVHNKRRPLATCMKLTRRSFIGLLPIAGISFAALWFLKHRDLVASYTVLEKVGSSQSTETTERAFDFPVSWNGGEPINVDSKQYRLIVDGNVSNPLQLTLEELYAMPSLSVSSTIHCIEGWSALVVWEGIALSRLLSLAGAGDFSQIRIESLTGYAMEIDQTDAAKAMIALKAESLPLKIEHGYPARLVLPGTIGFGWVKYVAKITCTKP